MNKFLILILVLVCIALSCCSNIEINTEQQTSVSKSQSIPNTLSDTVPNSKSDETMEILKSDDHKTIVTVYTYTDTERGNGINRIIDKIVVNNENNSFEINDVIGYYGNMRWALGQSKVIIEYYGRAWRDFLIIDTKNKEALFKGEFDFQLLMDNFKRQGAVFNFKINENRPDIEYRLNKMIDEDNISVDYIVHDENYTTQSGSFNYNLSKGTFSQLIQNEPKVEG